MSTGVGWFVGPVNSCFPKCDVDIVEYVSSKSDRVPENNAACFEGIELKEKERSFRDELFKAMDATGKVDPSEIRLNKRNVIGVVDATVPSQPVSRIQDQVELILSRCL